MNKSVALSMLTLLAACSGEPAGNDAAAPTASAMEAPAAAAEARLAQLALAVRYAEDLSAIKRLQKAYGYYVDKGLWSDAAALFSDTAIARYPAGTFIGKASITEHLFRNVGGVESGQVGLGDGRLYNHLNLQPVVHLSADGLSARGRWRAMAMLGRYGDAAGTWAEGIYNVTYAREDGVWKIRELDYTPDFADSYSTGWGGTPNPPARQPRELAHPADAPYTPACSGFPEACIAPFHYDNPGSGTGAFVWSLPEQPVSPIAATAATPVVAADLLRRAERLADEQAVENLIRSYGFYLERAAWDQVADLFANDATVEFAQRGVYRGKARIRDYFGSLGAMAGRSREQQGLVDGWLFDHMQLQIIVSVAPDGQSARARSREWGMTGLLGGQGWWHDGLYENRFVKEDGVWKFAALHYYPTFITPYDQGWTVAAEPAPGPLADLPPDAPPTEVYAIYPQTYVPAFHYRNPVTGTETQYPVRGAPSREAQLSTLFTAVAAAPPELPVAEALERTAVLVGRLKDHHEIENLENAYGYYLDKNLWNDLADLFAVNGSMELAQRGIYRGRERVREFLFKVFGAEGPQPSRLGNHLHLQPLITLATDGQRAEVRSRMLQQLSFNGRPSMGAAYYHNTLIKEEGRWKFLATHAYNTWGAAYAGGWTAAPSTRVPGPSTELPPDAPPSLVFAMFPTVYDIPYHYANPVTGRR